ncbi:MAG: hypothetical protein AAGJ08_25485 [Cyanobacteria bacterium P01_H01_bin.35]
MGIKHKNFLATVEKYKIEIEQDFGQLFFEMETVKNSVGARLRATSVSNGSCEWGVGANTETFCYLNETQANFFDDTQSKYSANGRNDKTTASIYGGLMSIYL